MSKNLIIVESPTKVKTIKKFLGSNYQVIASNGHIRDLPKSSLGIDIDNDFEPKYITIRGKGPKLNEIKKEVKKASKIYLATDPDREGEAIAWHIKNAVDSQEAKYKRIAFNEITKDAVKNAIKEPRDIDMKLVDAQQARRTLDRMVGYSISPLLWKKVKRGLSAGRVQSVALKLIADRDEEINDFIPREYLTIEGSFAVGNNAVKAKLSSENASDMNLVAEKVKEFVKKLKGENYIISDIKRGKKLRKSPLPFTTSTLQQEAAKKLNFPVSKTMKIAQELYEGIKIKDYGTIGLITYLRTDSTRISEVAKFAAEKYIESKFGNEYVNKETVIKNSSSSQDAHEAIRPSYIDIEPIKISESLTKDQYKLYNLIWNRFMASRMKAASFETVSINIKSDSGYIFKASTQKMIFEGFMTVYSDSILEKTDNALLNIAKSDKVELKSVKEEQHFTEPQPHYNEASLIKALESLGIGRPSTYAPTVATLKLRRYVTLDKKNLYITELGNAVNSIMKNCFKDIVDVDFTANMEKELDNIAEGKKEWKELIRKFYPDLNNNVINAEKKLEKIVIADEVTDEICEKCGRNMVIKYGPHGKFLACPGFPECRNSKPYYQKTGSKCPKCGKDIVIKYTPKNRKYFGCIDNPKCDFMSWNEPTGEKCPLCDGYLMKKGKKIVCSNKECNYGKK